MKGRRLCCLGMAAAWLMSGVLPAFAQAGPGSRPRLEVRRASSPVRIDGRLDEPAWKDSVATPVFGHIVSGAAPRYGTSARMLWDDQYLYVGYRLEDPNVWADRTIRDDPMGEQAPGTVLGAVPRRPLVGGWGVYEENFVKLYMDPDGDGKYYIELHVNPLGNVCDKWQVAPNSQETRERLKMPEKGPFPHPEWNCPGLKVAVHTEGSLNDPCDVDDFWSVEIAIPFSAIAGVARAQAVRFPPAAGDVWRVLFGRRYRASREDPDVTYWTWPAVGAVDCHQPDRWADVVFCGPKESEDFSDLPKAKFDWKAVWATSASAQTPEQIRQMADLVSRMGFNVVIYGGTADAPKQRFWGTNESRTFDPLQLVIEECRKRDIKVYVWMVNLCGLIPREYYARHPEHLQKVREWEEEAARMPRANPDRENVHANPRFLCPDQGLQDVERATLRELCAYGIDGVAFDYVGYRNYYACFCDFSNAKRLEFAEDNPDLTEKQVLTRFSEGCLVRYVSETKEFLKSLRPGLEFTIHIYPAFDPNPDYCARLPLRYCGITAAWFYKPFWSFGKIRDMCRQFKALEGSAADGWRFVPLVCIGGGERLKTADRLRTEIRICGAAGARDIMMIYYDVLRDNPELLKVVSEEL